MMKGGALNLARRIDPAQHGVARGSPFRRDCGGASGLKSLVESENSCKRLALGDLHCSGSVWGQKFRGQAKDEVSGLFKRADGGGCQNRSTVPGLLVADVVAHAVRLTRTIDSSPPDKRHRPVRQANDSAHSSTVAIACLCRFASEGASSRKTIARRRTSIAKDARKRGVCCTSSSASSGNVMRDAIARCRSPYLGSDSFIKSSATSAQLCNHPWAFCRLIRGHLYRAA